MSDVIFEVAQERERQDRKWGEQNHDLPLYFAILSEEVGEVAKEVVEHRFSADPRQRTERMLRARSELIQAAAVAVAMAEAIDRRCAEIGGEG